MTIALALKGNAPFGEVLLPVPKVLLPVPLCIVLLAAGCGSPTLQRKYFTILALKCCKDIYYQLPQQVPTTKAVNRTKAKRNLILN